MVALWRIYYKLGSKGIVIAMVQERHYTTIDAATSITSD